VTSIIDKHANDMTERAIRQFQKRQVLIIPAKGGHIEHFD